MRTGFAVLYAVVLVAASSMIAGCSSPGRTNNAVLAGGLILGTFTPNADIEQIYYLGVIDPINQVPEAIYRVSVRGQASAMSNVKFASGWVPAWTVDALNSGSGLTYAGKNQWLPPNCNDPATCVPPTGRRLVQFGPEGFREAPADHRLVIVMGADPSAFFNAIDQTLGSVAGVKLDKDNAELRKELTAALLQLKGDQNKLRQIQLKVLDEGLK